MPLELPHTAGCLVCGPGNCKGLRLQLFVDPETGIVQTRFAAKNRTHRVRGHAHGGMIATVMDEVMVWAATWAGKRFCLCGEMNVRFRRRAEVGQGLVCTGAGGIGAIEVDRDGRRGHGRIGAGRGDGDGQIRAAVG